MKNIWEILKIEETKDSRAIKRAYASLVKEYNPEDYPQEFLNIREAYEAAMAYAADFSQSQKLSVHAEETRQPNSEEEAFMSEAFMSEASDIEKGTEIVSEEMSSEVYQGFHWDFIEDTFYQEHPAVLKFKELYTGKRRKDRTAWADYFTSDDFLEVWRENEFTDILLKLVKEYQEAYPLSKEFLTELYLAYGMRYNNQQMFLENNAAFDGINHIMDIAVMGPAITRFKSNDQAVIEGFRDYRQLLSLASEENWNDHAFLRLSNIIDRYGLGNISDKPILDAHRYELSQRHPKSLRLISYFFAHTQLPAQAYRLLWNHLYLDNAVSGKNKLFYGSMRDTVIARMPEILEKPRVNYQKLNTEYGHYVYYFSSRRNEELSPEDEDLMIKDIDAFFAREDVQYALMDERYVEDHILRYWINKNGNIYFTHCLEDFYRIHKDAPYRERVLEVIEKWNTVNQVETQYLEDEQSMPKFGLIDFQKRPYVRYYLNTAFHLTYGVRNDILLSKYLENRLPYSKAWAQSFTNPVQGGFSLDRPVKIQFGENTIQIVFHLRYLEYHWNDKPFGPPFIWQRLKEIQDESTFWLLLPITLASFEEYPEVYEELNRRLEMLPLCENDIPIIADCICGKVCQFTEDIEYSLPLYTLYKETENQLYGCDIYKNGTLLLYEESVHSKNLLHNGQYQAGDIDTAISMAERLLDELTTPYSITASLTLMPDQIFVRNHWNQPSSLEGGQITTEGIQELLEKYFEGNLNRLELSWQKRALIFINDKGQYACLYFDDFKSGWYALVSMPEVYAIIDAKDVVSVPFGLSMLPNYLVHQNLNFIKNHLHEIFDQIACESAKPKSMMWSPKIYLSETKLQYHLAKRLFGGYTAEQTRNQLTDRFYIPILPKYISYTDTEGNSSGDLETTGNKMAVQEALFQYMKGRLSKLTLTWQYEETTAGLEPLLQMRKIVLLQELGRHQMFYLDNQKQGLEYLVADVNEYLNANGKKSRKTSFQGKTVLGYLVHENLIRIRDYLDLLIPQIRYPNAILGIFGEFSYEINEKFEG